jgi:hypothetical protein
MANMESTYALRKAALAKMAEPSSVAAVPDLGEVAGEYAEARGKVAAESAAHARNISLGEKSLAEKNRQFYASLDLDRERLDNWADQNRWATGIAIANLGIQALAIPGAIRQEEKQEKMISAIFAERGKQTAAATAANEALAASQGKAFGDIRAIALALRAANPELFPQTTGTEDLNAVARRKIGGMPVLYSH